MEKKSYVFEGKTTNEAIEKGLNELKVSKSMVDIKVLEQEDKRSFFSILTPRVVKVEMTIKENAVKEEKTVKTEKKDSNVDLNKEELEEKTHKFMD